MQRTYLMMAKDAKEAVLLFFRMSRGICCTRHCLVLLLMTTNSWCKCSNYKQPKWSWLKEFAAFRIKPRKTVFLLLKLLYLSVLLSFLSNGQVDRLRLGESVLGNGCSTLSYISVGNSVLSSAIWEEDRRTSEFLKRVHIFPNCTRSPAITN